MFKFVSYGREGNFNQPELLSVGPGKCNDQEMVDTSDKCLERFEIKRHNLVEWYDNKKGKIEHGFDLQTRPGGQGLLEIKMAVENGTLKESKEGVAFFHKGRKIALYKNLYVIDKNNKRVDGRILSRRDSIILQIDDKDLQYPLVVDPVIVGTAQKLLPEMIDGYGEVFPGSEFGVSVAVDGSYAIVGASGYKAALGAAYILHKDGGEENQWELVKKLIASNGAANDRFGSSVSISGTTAIVGANG